MRKAFLIFFISIIILSQAKALRISGKDVKVEMDFEPNKVQQWDFHVLNEEGYTSTYDITIERYKGGDITEYFSVTPERMENVEHGEVRKFTVRMELPEKIETPGNNEVLAKVTIDTQSSGVIRGVPSVAVRYIIFVLYPSKYVQWSVSAPNMNRDEYQDIVVNIENLGEPTILEAYADIDIIDLSTNQTIKSLSTQKESNIASWEKRKLTTQINSHGMDPGNYRADATLYFDGNISTKQTNFRVGTKEVKIVNYTRLFESEAINKMEIEVESAWNTKIGNIYADITVSNESGTLRSFKSFDTDLNAWEKKKLEAYFDTSGIGRGEYPATIVLNYEGAKTQEQGTIVIDEDTGAETHEEIPKQKIIDFSGVITPINILAVLLVIFIIINIILLIGYFKNKSGKEEIDEAVLEKVRQMRKKYNDNYIKEYMLKKGWSEEKIENILKHE